MQYIPIYSADLYFFTDTKILQADFASHYAKMMAERKFMEEFDVSLCQNI